MPNVIQTIAIATFRESIRDRILLSLLVFGLLLLGGTIFLGSISLDQDAKIIIDLGLLGIYFFGVIITLFIGSSAIAKELDQRTAYTILARPLKRWWFVVGKFYGLSLTIGTLVLLMGLVFGAVLSFRLGWHAIDAALVMSIFYIFLELLVLTAMIVCFSSFTSSVMSTIYTVALFLIGHSSASVVALAKNSNAGGRYLFQAIYYVLPNLEKFNLRNDAVYHLKPETSQVALVIAYTAIFCSVFLYLAALALKKQEL